LCLYTWPLEAGFLCSIGSPYRSAVFQPFGDDGFGLSFQSFLAWEGFAKPFDGLTTDE